MSEPFLGQICLFGFNFAPQNWQLCDGSLLSIRTYPALYSLLGTIYGGDGTSTFGVPDLRGRRPVGMGSGPGLQTYNLGQKGGSETATLTAANLPPHTHGTTVQVNGDQRSPITAAQNGYLLAANAVAYVPSTASASTLLGSGNVTVLPNTGGSASFSVVDPYTALNFCIAIAGQYPTRP